MTRLLIAAAFSLLVGFALPGHAAEPVSPPPKRILFIGNSLTASTDIPGRLEKLARVMGHPCRVHSVTANGYSLQDHWRDGRALAEIRKGWDVVVLQQGTSAYAEGASEMLEYVKRFSAPIREAGAQPAVYMVWPLVDRAREFPDAIYAHRRAAETSKAILLPVGEAWLRVLSKDKRVKLYSDGIHPTSLGSDLAVLTIYLSLFPAGPREFDEAYVEKIARELEMPASRRDAFFDAATLAIDEPMLIK